MSRSRPHRRIAPVVLLVAIQLAFLGATPASAASCSGDATNRAEVVVKIDLAGGHTVAELVAAEPVAVVAAMSLSRGLFVVRATNPSYCRTYDWAKKLADRIEDHRAVVYAEPNYSAEMSDGRFHAWPDGDPVDAGTDAAVVTDQLAARQLGLADAHTVSRGAGTVVAVFDTGVDPNHPALAGRLLPAWDYVDDDADPQEVRDGIDGDGDGAVDESYGHGTFVSGVVALVAPDALIMPVRVLDSDGRGNVFVVAEALADATAAGVDVINLSFGMASKPMTPLIEEAIKDARKQGVVVVAAAGNEATTAEQYPAALSEAVAVTALDEVGTRLASYANSGGWVDVAAPGTRIAGPVPGGAYAWWNGTSIAAPFVSGQMALVVAASPDLSADKVIDAVIKSARVVKLRRQADIRVVQTVASLSALG